MAEKHDRFPSRQAESRAGTKKGDCSRLSAQELPLELDPWLADQEESGETPRPPFSSGQYLQAEHQDSGTDGLSHSEDFRWLLLSPQCRGKGGLSRSRKTQAENIERLLNAARTIASCGSPSSRFRFEEGDISPLWVASKDPPVTAASLSVLNPQQIHKYPQLSHDLNFESHFVLQPEPKLSAGTYFAALAVEFALYIQHNDRSTKYSYLYCLTANAQKAPTLRLHRLFATIRDILKTLLHPEYGQEIDYTIDPDLLVHQISNGCCDLGRFAEQVGFFLKRIHSQSSPLDQFVRQTKDAERTRDPCLLASAVEHLFEILEGAKLSICHSYIWAHRLRLIEQSVDCEQVYFRDQLATGWDISSSISWYQAVLSKDLDPLVTISSSVARAVQAPQYTLPETFDYDRDRLDGLYVDYKSISAEAAIRDAIEHVVQRGLRARGQGPVCLSPKILNAATRQVKKVDLPFCFWSTSHPESGSSFDRVALEVARAASVIYRNRKIPLSDDVCFAEARLSQLKKQKTPPSLPKSKCLTSDIVSDSPNQPDFSSMNRSALADVGVQHELGLCKQLDAFINEQLARMRTLSAVELYSRYVIGTPAAAVPQAVTCMPLQAGLDASSLKKVGGLGPVSLPLSGNDTLDQLVILAQKIAHITIVHWRVWGSLLSDLAGPENI